MLTFFAPMNNLGYGVHSYNLLKSLDKMGVNIGLFTPYGQSHINDDLVKKWSENASESKIDSPAIMIFHEQFLRHFSGKPRIGFPVFEVDKLTKADLNKMKGCDAIIQTSTWGKEILDKHGVEKVYVVPEGHDPEIFFPDVSVELAIHTMKESVDFVHVGKYEQRKSTIEILKAFDLAIHEHPRSTVLRFHALNPFNGAWYNSVVNELVALGWRPSIDSEFATTLTKHKSMVEIKKRQLPTSVDMSNFLCQHHFGIYASRAEGWNLPLMETIACGVPCFTTNVTAQSEYITDHYPEELLFKVGDWIPANDGAWFHGEGEWFNPDWKAMGAKIRDVLNDPEKHYKRFREETYDCVKGFTWESSAKRLMSVLEEIWSET